MKPLHETLRDVIRRRKQTHYRVAKDAGVATAIIDRFMSGERDIRLGTASKVAAALGLELVEVKKLS